MHVGRTTPDLMTLARAARVVSRPAPIRRLRYARRGAPHQRVRRRRPAPGAHPDRARDRRAQPRRRATSCWSACTPGASRSPSAWPPRSRRSRGSSVPVGALDVSFYRDDIGLRPVAPLGPTEVPDISGHGRRARRRRAVHRPHRPGRARRAARARPPAGGPARGAASTAVTASSRCEPTSSGKNLPDPGRRGRPRAALRGRRRRRRRRAVGPAGRSVVKHLLAVDDLAELDPSGAADARTCAPGSSRCSTSPLRSSR